MMVGSVSSVGWIFQVELVLIVLAVPVRRVSGRMFVWVHNKVVGMGGSVSTNTLEGCSRDSYLGYSVPQVLWVMCGIVSTNTLLI